MEVYLRQSQQCILQDLEDGRSIASKIAANPLNK